MPRGRPTSLRVELTPADRATLEAWWRSTTIAWGLAQRARTILLVADGAADRGHCGHDRQHAPLCV